MAHKLSISNHKGGVAKTTTAVELATALALKRKRTLLIDFDPQASASLLLDLKDHVLGPNTYVSRNLLLGQGDWSPQRDHLVEGLDVVPSSLSLGSAEPLITAKTPDLLSQSRHLSDAIRNVEKDYDFILIDCPPALGTLTNNALFACPEVLAPVKLEPLSMMGIFDLFNHVKMLKQTLQPQLRFLGALPTFYDERLKTSKEMLASLKDVFSAEGVCSTVIHTSTQFAGASAVYRPLGLINAKSRGAMEYSELAEEVIARVR